MIPSLTFDLRLALWDAHQTAIDPAEATRLGGLYADVAEAQACSVCHDHRPFCRRAPWIGHDDLIFAASGCN